MSDRGNKRSGSIFPCKSSRHTKNAYSALRNQLFRSVMSDTYLSLKTEEEQKAFLVEACEDVLEARTKQDIPSCNPDLPLMVDNFLSRQQWKEPTASTNNLSEQMQSNPVFQQTQSPYASQPTLNATGFQQPQDGPAFQPSQSPFASQQTQSTPGLQQTHITPTPAVTAEDAQTHHALPEQLPQPKATDTCSAPLKVAKEAEAPTAIPEQLPLPKVAVTRASPLPEPLSTAKTHTKTRAKSENAALKLIKETHAMVQKQLHQDDKIQQAPQQQETRLKTLQDEMYHVKKGVGVLRDQFRQAHEGMEAVHKELHGMRQAMDAGHDEARHTNEVVEGLAETVRDLQDLVMVLIQRHQPVNNNTRGAAARRSAHNAAGTELGKEAKSDDSSTGNVPSGTNSNAAKRTYEQMAQGASADGNGQPAEDQSRNARDLPHNEAEATPRRTDLSVQPGSM